MKTGTPMGMQTTRTFKMQPNMAIRMDMIIHMVMVIIIKPWLSECLENRKPSPEPSRYQ